MKYFPYLLIIGMALLACQHQQDEKQQGAFPFFLTEDKPDRSEFKPSKVGMQGLAVAEDPLGPFEKHPLNPLINSGHETTPGAIHNKIYSQL